MRFCTDVLNASVCFKMAVFYVALLFKALNKVFTAHSPIHAPTHTPMTVSYHAGCWPDQREQFGIQCLAQASIKAEKVYVSVLNRETHRCHRERQDVINRTNGDNGALMVFSCTYEKRQKLCKEF